MKDVRSCSRAVVLALASLALASLTACGGGGGGGGGGGFTVTVAKQGSGAGSVTSSPAGIDCGSACTARFDGGSVTLTATAAASSAFTGWSGDCNGTTATCVLSMTDNHSVTARFAPALTVEKSGAGGGKVTSIPGGIDCGTTCKAGYTGGRVTLVATPDGTSLFTGWSGDCTGTTTCVVPMTAARSVTATFGTAVVVAKGGYGDGWITSTPAGIECGSACRIATGAGTVTLTVAAYQSSTFTGWSGACTGTATTCTVPLAAATSVTASFDWITSGPDAWHARKPGRQAIDLSGSAYVSTEAGTGRFPLVASAAAPLVVSSVDDGEYPGVVRAVGDLRNDIASVTGKTPAIADDTSAGGAMVLIGTRGHSELIDGLVASGKISASALDGKWESWITTVVDGNLVIAGSDQRGTIFGIYDLSRQIGVSPWCFWDDVKPAHKATLYVLPGVHTLGEPSVKYRGFFINDESPALTGWWSHFGGTSTFNHELYGHVFELMLRLRANYLWPAVWGKRFTSDDPQNRATAKAYGVVMGTPHDAPMARPIDDWAATYTTYGAFPSGLAQDKAYSYRLYPEAIRAYWKDGIDAMVAGDFENVVTVGMRGSAGDTSLVDGTALPLMRDILSAQQRLIATQTGEDPAQTPQVWTLYKEVQGYWDRGLRAPSDMTIMFCDDNWSNIRALPNLADPSRTGGYGLYYHFDYVGAPRSYMWTDTNLLPNVWEQMNLAYTYGVDRLWVVNAGDLKGMERPTQFFLDLAWSPETWTLDRLTEWQRRFAAENVSSTYATQVADLLLRYERLQSRIKPELLNNVYTYSKAAGVQTPSTDIGHPIGSVGSPFSLVAYQELEGVVDEWAALRLAAEDLKAELDATQQDAYFELVLYNIQASENVYRLRLAQFRNRLYSDQGRASTTDEAAKANALFKDQGTVNYADLSADADLTHLFDTIAGGKWNGYAHSAKFGFTNYRGPDTSADTIQPPLKETVTLSATAAMGVAVDGSTAWCPGPVATPTTTLTLTELSPYLTAPAPYLEVFSRGTPAFGYTITKSPDRSWLHLSSASGTLDGTTHKQVRVEVTADWDAVPAGTDENVTLTVARGGSSEAFTVVVPVFKPAAAPPSNVWVEAGGYVSMEAMNARKIDQGSISWVIIPNIGRTASGVTPFPQTTARQAAAGNSPRLEFDMYLYSAGNVTVWVYASPRNNVLATRPIAGEGLKYAVSFDAANPTTVNIHAADQTNAFDDGTDLTSVDGWMRNVADNTARTYHRTTTPLAAGAHTLRIWMMDPTVIVQKVVVDTGGLRDSYLGPPESWNSSLLP